MERFCVENIVNIVYPEKSQMLSNEIFVDPTEPMLLSDKKGLLVSAAHDLSFLT